MATKVTTITVAKTTTVPVKSPTKVIAPLITDSHPGASKYLDAFNRALNAPTYGMIDDAVTESNLRGQSVGWIP